MLRGGEQTFVNGGTCTLALYTDPGSGVLLLQALVAAFFGGLFYFRKAIARIFFWKRNNTSKE